MRNLHRGQKGQAFTELLLVFFLFTMFVTGVTQLVMIGSARIQLEQAARRGVWLRNRLNTSSMDDEEIQALLPGYKLTIDKIAGNQNDGWSFRFSCTVPAIGFFSWFQPNGFKLSTQSAVIGYIEKPLTAGQLVQDAYKRICDMLGQPSN